MLDAAENRELSIPRENDVETFDPIAYLTTPRWQKVSLGLERTRALLDQLERPQDKLRFVHVAGTNGKGSTCALIASVFQQAGYKVGLFTSPALYSFEERICVNGKPILADQLHDITREVKSAVDDLMDTKARSQHGDRVKVLNDHPTEFELLTAVAFTYFERCSCDIVVAEVGLGGRLDSTNVIDTAEVSVITSLSLDHRALLGNTIEEIAREKAGIIKPHVPVVSSPQQPAALAVIEQVVGDHRTSLEIVDIAKLSGTATCFSYRDRKGLSLGLLGSFQLVNAATALDTIDTLCAQGWCISEDAIRVGLKEVRWPGRFEVVSKSPLVIVDGGHNAAGVRVLTQALDELHSKHRRILITGVLEDKDHQEMAAMFVENFEQIFVLTPENPRALDARVYAEELRQAAKDAGRKVSISAAASIEAGVQQALHSYDRIVEENKLFLGKPVKNALVADRVTQPPLVCVAGSLYLLGSVMEVLRQVGVAL